MMHKEAEEPEVVWMDKLATPEKQAEKLVPSMRPKVGAIYRTLSEDMAEKLGEGHRLNTKHRRLLVMTMILEGHSIRAISHAFNVSHNTIVSDCNWNWPNEESPAALERAINYERISYKALKRIEAMIDDVETTLDLRDLTRVVEVATRRLGLIAQEKQKERELVMQEKVLNMDGRGRLEGQDGMVEIDGDSGQDYVEMQRAKIKALPSVTHSDGNTT